MAKTGVNTIQGSLRLNRAYQTNRYAFGLGKVIVALKTLEGLSLGAKAVYVGGKQVMVATSTGIAGYQLVHQNSIQLANLLAKQKSRGRGSSLTSELMTPRHHDTTLSNRGGAPSQSKGRAATARGRARRQTSYCKVHGKYDFCEYYKK